MNFEFIIYFILATFSLLCLFIKNLFNLFVIKIKSTIKWIPCIVKTYNMHWKLKKREKKRENKNYITTIITYTVRKCLVYWTFTKTPLQVSAYRPPQFFLTPTFRAVTLTKTSWTLNKYIIARSYCAYYIFFLLRSLYFNTVFYYIFCVLV